MQKFYIENRIWYVGYTWINFDDQKISEIAALQDLNLTMFEARAFTFNNYAGTNSDDMLYASYTADKLYGKFQNQDYDPSKTHLEFKFLKNGCVNIILTMEPKERDGFSNVIDKLDQDGGEYFEKYNDDILDLLLLLLQTLVTPKDEKNGAIIECNKTSLWGIPSLLSKKPLDLKKLSEFGLDPKNMLGTKTLHWSVLYNQNIVSKDEDDYRRFKDVEGQEFEEIQLRTIPTLDSASNSIKATLGWGKKYWNGGSNELNDVKNFLEVDSVNLSKIVMLATSIYFNTELSLILLKDTDLSNRASVDQLRKPNALIRTHLSYTEMFTQEFSEEAKTFYEKIDQLESKTMQERIRLQKESQETLLELANTTEVGKSQVKAEWFQFFLAVISAMTIFSVLQDITSFVFVSETPSPEDFRLSIVLIVSMVVIWFLRDLLPLKK
jgi:hypothetical protein